MFLLVAVLFGPVGRVVADLLGIYALLIVAMSIMSFFPLQRGGAGEQVFHFLLRITDPVLRPVRRAMPQFGTIDISPLIVILFISLLRTLILG